MTNRCSICGTTPFSICNKYGHAIIWQGERGGPAMMRCCGCNDTGFKWVAMTPGAPGTLVPCNRFKSCREARAKKEAP
jgi:hypothetical protein